jgi:putative ABC transport system permease protein
VTPRFFQALGIPVLAGRGISEQDRQDAEPVAVVSRAMAERFWPGKNPVGRLVRNAREGDDGPWMKIVGVVADVREHYDIEETWYLPYAQHAGSGPAGQTVFVLRSELPASDAAESVRQAVQRVDPSLPVERVVSARERYHDSLEGERATSWMAGAFALFGLIIALLGVAGVTAFAVAARRHEMGLRLALGAERSDLLRVVLSGVARWAGLGVVAGVLGYGLVARWLATRMPDSVALAPSVLGVLALFLIVSGVAVAALPAVRASRVDPLEALRRE